MQLTEKVLLKVLRNDPNTDADVLSFIELFRLAEECILSHEDELVYFHFSNAHETDAHSLLLPSPEAS